MKVSHSPLRINLEKGMKSLRCTNRFIATAKKLRTFIDCASIYQKFKGKAQSEHSIKNSRADPGFINLIDDCPNIHGVIKTRNTFYIKSLQKNIFRKFYNAH